MARLSVFHMLCPLIDQSSFLGVANDSNKDCVIVTLGRNIVIRYKIIDRKQVGSWSTRDKLTSPVIYDEIGRRYVAVFNRSQIRTWKQDDEDLDRAKKYKVSEEIQCVLVCHGVKVEPIVLLQSGRVCWLSRFIQNKDKILNGWSQEGSKTVLKSNENLEDWHMITCQAETYVFLSARSSTISKQLSFYMVHLSSKEEEDYTVLKRFSLKLPDAQLVGHTIIQQNDNSSLITLWSNGKIYSLSLSTFMKIHEGEESDLVIPEKSREDECLKCPGRLVDSVKGLLDVENAVTLVALGPNHIALYGAEPGLTGGVVYIVDIHSSVTGDLPWEALKESAAKQSLKHFDTKEMPPRIWNAAGYLFVPSSEGRLVLASYELGSHPPLSDLLGCLWKNTKNKNSIKNNNNNGIVHHHNQVEQVNWLNSTKPAVQIKQITSGSDEIKPVPGEPYILKEENVPENVSLKLKPLIKQGLPESSICLMILPSLMEDGDIESISWCISHFRDIPEANLVDLLCFFLNQKPVCTVAKKEELKSESCGDDVSKSPLKSSHDLPSSPKVAKGKMSQADVESVKVLMNGDVHEPMDTDACDSHVEDSEVEGFEVGHTFVKGRRRSLRMMKVPAADSPAPAVGGSAKKVLKSEKLSSQDVSDMEVESCNTPVKCAVKKRGRRNSSMVLNGLGVVQEDVEVNRCSESRVDGIAERNAVVNVKCEEEGGGIGRTTIVEAIDKDVERPSLVIEEEKKWSILALPHEQHRHVGKILSVPVSSIPLTTQLRSRLPFTMALKLLRHLLWLLSTPPAPEKPSLTDIQVVDWICHLLDAFYQRFTLSSDDEVKDTLAATKEVLDVQLQLIDALKEIAPVVLQLKSGKKAEENACDKWYSIENIRLY